MAYVGIAFLSHRYLFDIKWDQGGFSMDPKLKFSQADFNQFLEGATITGISFGGLALMFSGLMAFFKCLNPVDELSKNQNFILKILSFLTSVLYLLIAFAMFLLSLPVFTRGIGQKVPEPFYGLDAKFLPPGLIHQASELHLVSSYGLFRRMTGVGGRPEIVIEAADNMAGPWTEYNFMYKPGNVSEAPKFILPHQPRLDWQMWFAALGNYQENPWFISLLYRILEGNIENSSVDKSEP